MHFYASFTIKKVEISYSSGLLLWNLLLDWFCCVYSEILISWGDRILPDNINNMFLYLIYIFSAELHPIVWLITNSVLFSWFKMLFLANFFYSNAWHLFVIIIQNVEFFIEYFIFHRYLIFCFVVFFLYYTKLIKKKIVIITATYGVTLK